MRKVRQPAAMCDYRRKVTFPPDRQAREDTGINQPDSFYSSRRTRLIAGFRMRYSFVRGRTAW
jgi:hypothetical protein